MMALGVALMIGPLGVAGTTCEKPTTANVKCEHDLATELGEIIMDCTDAANIFAPPKMGDDFNCSVCAAATKWENADQVCADGDTASNTSLQKKGVSIRCDSSGKKVHIIHLGYKEEKDLLLQGSCKNTDGSKSAFFNITVKKSAAFFALNSVGSIVMAIAATGLLSFH